MEFAATSSATVKKPPAYSAGPLPSLKTVRALTKQMPKRGENRPLSSADQVEPSHLAMQLAGTPPALAKSPAT
jgi:hypothetical protein